jgi:hypothetical protein
VERAKCREGGEAEQTGYGNGQHRTNLSSGGTRESPRVFPVKSNVHYMFLLVKSTAHSAAPRRGELMLDFVGHCG